MGLKGSCRDWEKGHRGTRDKKTGSEACWEKGEGQDSGVEGGLLERKSGLEEFKMFAVLVLC